VLRFTGTTDVLKQIGTKAIRLSPNSELEFYGAANDEFDSRIVNSGGLLKLSQGASIVLKGGDIVTPGYLQESNATSRLHLMNGSVLSATNGVRVDGGSMFIIINLNLPANQQSAMIDGKLTWTNGDLLFSPPQAFGNDWAYGTFYVHGDVKWEGGRYLPSVDGLVNGVASKWIVQGTLTVDATKTIKPRIEPITQRLPAGQQATGTFEVIEATVKIEGDDPQTPDGWDLLSQNVGGVKKKWSVKR
jgi:hypothetical protein